MNTTIVWSTDSDYKARTSTRIIDLASAALIIGVSEISLTCCVGTVLQPPNANNDANTKTM